MSQTDPLNVLADFGRPERHLVIHPNDGFDIGLMTTEHDVEVEYPYDGETAIPGKIFLKNECRQGSVEISLKASEKLGKPTAVTLSYTDGRLTILPA